jgi:outer membrane protein TolC
VVTWQGVIRLALSSNVNYVALLQDARAEYFRVRAKSDWQNPQLLLNANMPQSRPLEHSEEDKQYGLRMRFYIPNPFVNDDVLSSATASRRTLEEEARIKRSEAALVVYQLCSELQMAQALLDIHRRRSECFVLLEQYLRERFDNRLISAAEVQSNQIQMMRHEMAVERLKQSIQTTRRTLSILARIPADTIHLPPLSSELAIAASGIAQKRQVVAMSPEYRAAVEASKKTAADYKVAKDANIPWLEYVDTGYSFRDSHDEGQWQLRAAFVLPVFSGSMEKAAHAAHTAATLREADVEQQLKARYDSLQLDLRDAWAAIGRLPKIPVPVKDTAIDLERYYKMCDDCLALEEQQLELLYRPLVVCGELFHVLNSWERVKE